MTRAIGGLLAVVLLVATAGCAADDGAPRLPPPAEGVLYGVGLDWAADPPVSYNQRLGHRPSVYVAFAAFPLTDEVWSSLEGVAAQVVGQRGRLMLTLEPHEGLDSVTDETVEQLADRMAELNAGGIPVYLRFAHEMNGSWYPWGQQPDAYVEAFRRVAAAVRSRASDTAMVWSPNHGDGYPFPGGAFQGQVDGGDPYEPYYPGDDVVDWVGLSLYHWGTSYPWGENAVPEPGKFEQLLRGTYTRSGGEQPQPDFYERYHLEHGKPIAVTETAALYIPDRAGSALEIKRAWWQQVFAADLPERLPGVRMINWFEWRKFETEVDAVVDWTATADPSVSSAYTAELPDWLLFAE